MFCPYCGKNNKEGTIFCVYCQKAIPQSAQSESKPIETQNTKQRKPIISVTAIKGIITILLIAGLVLAILWAYYPSLLPWNW
jgi:uncharacterized membrane protein YvbJ